MPQSQDVQDRYSLAKLHLQVLPGGMRYGDTIDGNVDGNVDGLMDAILRIFLNNLHSDSPRLVADTDPSHGQWLKDFNLFPLTPR